MTAQPRGPAHLPLDQLTPDRFEALVFLLARSVDPQVVPVRAPDHGLDARLPGPSGTTLRGWQAKRYTRAINWTECRQSVRRARGFWRPPRLTFCFSRDLTALEQRALSDVAREFPDLRIDHWPGSELQRLIRDTPEGQRAAAWLFENPDADRAALLRALAVGGELSDTRQALERQAVIQEFVDRDPHFYYNLVSRNPDAPETPPAAETIISVTITVAGQEIRVDASPRYVGAAEDAGAVARLAFTKDEDGQQARQVVERLARDGGSATLSAGLGAVLPSIPVGLRGLMPEEGVWGLAEVSSEPTASNTAAAPEFRQSVIVRVGEVELGMVLIPGEPAAGWDGVVTGAAGGLQVFFSVRGPEDSIESRLDWRFTPGEGTANEQRLAAHIMLEAVHGGSVEIVDPADENRVLIAGTMDAVEGREAWKSELETRLAFLRYATEVEAWTGVPLRPPAVPTEDDSEVLSRLVSQLRQPEASFTWSEVRLGSGSQQPDVEPFQLAALQPVHAILFGEELYLGMELLHFNSARAERDSEGVRLVPANDDPHGTVRLFHPDDAPAEAARFPN